MLATAALQAPDRLWITDALASELAPTLYSVLQVSIGNPAIRSPIRISCRNASRALVGASLLARANA